MKTRLKLGSAERRQGIGELAGYKHLTPTGVKKVNTRLSGEQVKRGTGNRSESVRARAEAKPTRTFLPALWTAVIIRRSVRGRT